MQNLLKQYKEKNPEIVFEWSDQETDAKGWVVINSLRNGAAGGGTRMRKGLTKSEVISLSKVMEIKFTVSGPPIGGAKSGINFDPNDSRKDEVLKRWYKAVMPLLKSYYGTGGDLNIDELKDVIPITEGLGLWHPQEGIVNGHLHSPDGDKINILGQLRHGCAKIVENAEFVPNSDHKYAVADLITGYGVAESVVHYYDIFEKSDIKDKKVIIQGWGNVASAAAMYLAYKGAKIVGIIDKVGGIIAIKGLMFNEIKALFENKKSNRLETSELLTFEKTNELIWDIEADIFIPGAASKIVTRSQIDRLMKKGLQLISCGANVPFVDDEIFFGPTASFIDTKIAVIPDFIANCGMARVFAYFMEKGALMTDKGIFDDVSDTIKNALHKVYIEDKTGKNISNKALEMALTKLV